MQPKDTPQSSPANPPAAPTANTSPDPSRRRFLTRFGVALAGGAVLGKASIAKAANFNDAPGSTLPSGADSRVAQGRAIRVAAAGAEASIPVPPHTTNGDEERYRDKSGTYTKGILQDGICLVNLAAYKSFRKAINSGKFSDWENIITGGPRTQNGPLGGRAFSLEGSDDVQFGDAPSPRNQVNQVVVPPAPAVASEAYGTELIEMYWASVCRDIAFSDYATDPLTIAAAAEVGQPAGLPRSARQQWSCHA